MTANQTISQDACAAQPSCAEVHQSLRLPVFTLFAGAALWLVISSVFALIASIKFHSPGFLADCAEFTYGRVHAAHLNALAYGFAAQAGLGVALALLARSGKTKLALPAGSFIASVAWNIGVAVGVGGILAGHNTGFEWLEFTQAGSVILFFSYLILALAGLLTYAKRNDNQCVSQTFMVTALFWFPWIYVTAAALLGCAPVRGTMQSIVAWWFANNFLFVWLGLISLGTVFHFAPKYAGRPLHSRPQALLVLLVLVSFGSWAGIPSNAPVPAWIPALSSFGAFVSVTAALALIVNLKNTMGGCQSRDCDAVGKFFCKSVPMFCLFVVARAIFAFSCVNAFVGLTWFVTALDYLLVYGFLAMVLLGSIYRITPRLTQVEFPCAKSIGRHFWLMLIGVILLVLPLVVAGVKQGQALKNPAVSNADIAKGWMMMFRLTTLGDLLILVGAFLLLLNLIGLLCRYCKTCCAGQTAEVKK